MLPDTNEIDRHILIVDNDRDFAKSIAETLTLRGYIIEVVNNGAEAEQVISEFDAEVALIDIRLGVTSGIDLIKKLQKAKHNILCVMMTVHAKKRNAIQALKEGAYDYLSKPFQVDELLFTLDRCYEKIITEQKKIETENALRKSEIRLQSIIENTTAVIFIKDIEGKYIMINRRYESLFHITKEKIIGKTDYDIFPKEMADQFRINDLKVLKTEKPLELEEIVSQDDGLHTYISIKFPLNDTSGKPYAVCGIATDITDRKRIEKTHKQTLEQLRTSIQKMPIAYIIWDSEFRVLEWNDAAEQIFGYRRNESLGKNILKIIVPDKVRPRVQVALDKLLAGHSYSYSEKDNNIRKDGTLISCQWHNTPIKDREGKMTGVLSMAEDITERLLVEEALHNIATRFFSGTGKEFFSTVALHLQKTLNVDYALIGEIVDRKQDRIRILGISGKGNNMITFEYPIALAPCKYVIDKKTCLSYSGVQQQFPEFPLFANLGVESYLGTSLMNRSGKPIGIMALFNTTPITNQKIAKATLNIFGERVSAEIERYRANEALRHKTKLIELFQEITFTANEAMTVEEAMQICLDKVCLFTGWPIGHIYLSDPEGRKMIPSKIWHLTGPPQRFETFREITEVTWLDIGVGLPGRVLKSGKPAWIKDVSKDSNFPRAKSAKHINVKAGFAFPVLEGKKVVAVLEFFSDESKEPDDTMLKALSNLAVQLGRVTERKRSEESIIKLNNAIEQAAEMVLITDSSGTIEYVNSAVEETLGYSKEELIGKNPRIWKSGRHDNKFYKELWQTILSGEKWQGRMINKKKNGKLITEEVNISQVIDAKGNLTHFVSIKRDITKELLLEGKLQQSQKMEAIGTLTGGIAHDFNNLLTSIIGFTQLTLEDRDLNERNRNNMDRVFKSACRAKDIVSQLLVFSRKTETDKFTVNLSEIFSESFKMLRSFLPTSIDIKEYVDPTIYSISANITQIQQIIMNLAINASHAMPNGGTLSLTLKNADYDQYEVIPGKTISGPYVVLIIEDTGSGMSNETMSRIFDPFFTTKERGKGTGLGLATTYSIIQQHKGEITVESNKGKGTIFTVFLPSVSTADKVVSKEKIQEPVCGGNESILLIDDEEDITALGKKTLEELGYKVKCFNRSPDALKMFCSHPNDFDLVITDQTMPSMTGDKIAKELLRIRKDIPIILCTGYKDTINRKNSIEIGIKKVMMKPFEVEDLGRVVGHILDETIRAGTSNKRQTDLPLSTEPIRGVPKVSNLKQNTSNKINVITSETQYIVSIEGNIDVNEGEISQLLNYYIKARKEGKKVIVNCSEKVKQKLTEAAFDKFLSINHIEAPRS